MIARHVDVGGVSGLGALLRRMTTPTQSPYERLAAAAAHARMIFQRVSGEGSVLEQIERGEWSGQLDESAATDAADLIEAAAEQVRQTRALSGSLTVGHDTAEIALSTLKGVLDTGLPINRKERFYTGTVLPMIVAADGFAHLDRLLVLCGLPSAGLSGNPLEGHHPISFFTEYNFAESRYTAKDKQRFPDPPGEADTPDVVISGSDWLLCIEAKVFHNPGVESLNKQIARQKVLVDYWTKTLRLDPARVAHVLLLPAGLRASGTTVRVVTWEDLLAAYRVVGPTYWVAMLATALNGYKDLVSKPDTYGRNAATKMTGQAIQAGAADGTLTYAYMGRSGGLHGLALIEDIAVGRWRTQKYEVRSEPLPDNPNWFAVASFLASLQVD